MSYCLHSPSQAQSAVHGIFSFTHLQRLVMQPHLQPQRLSSGEHFAASGTVIQTGCHTLSTNHWGWASLAAVPVTGSTHTLPDKWLTVCVALRHHKLAEYFEWIFLFANNFFLATLTLSQSQLASYKRTTDCCKMLKQLSDMACEIVQ